MVDVEGTPERDTDGRDADLTLEERLSRLEAIVAALESREVELERALQLFEEGVGHVRAAEALLRTAELRVEELVGGDDSEGMATRPFEGGSSGG